MHGVINDSISPRPPKFSSQCFDINRRELVCKTNLRRAARSILAINAWRFRRKLILNYADRAGSHPTKHEPSIGRSLGPRQVEQPRLAKNQLAAYRVKVYLRDTSRFVAKICTDKNGLGVMVRGAGPFVLKVGHFGGGLHLGSDEYLVGRTGRVEHGADCMRPIGR